MAGYIMTIGDSENVSDFDNEECSAFQKKLLAKDKSMSLCIKNGVYATRISQKSSAKISTRADFFSMRPGDNIYFFYNRTIYGIGEIIDIDGTSAFYNDEDFPLYDDVGDVKTHPYLCLFKASPFFFKNGVDMDDALMSNPVAFRKLRFFHKRSFIQLDDIENASLKSYIIKNNEECLETFDFCKHYSIDNVEAVHDKIRNKYLTDKTRYKLDAVSAFKEGCTKKRSPFMVKSESFIEGIILDYVKTNNRLFGYYDFMSRQYVASPNKPAEYAEFMDMFGYRYVKGYKKDGIISKYVVIEIKTGKITEYAILQVMKYVDWVCKTFAHNDYSMIVAYVIGYDVDGELLESNKKLFTRNYIKSSKHNGNRGVYVETGCW